MTESKEYFMILTDAYGSALEQAAEQYTAQHIGRIVVERLAEPETTFRVGIAPGYYPVSDGSYRVYKGNFIERDVPDGFGGYRIVYTDDVSRHAVHKLARANYFTKTASADQAASKPVV